MSRPLTNLILVGGISHDFEASAQALAEILQPLGIESRLEPDLEAGLASLVETPVDLLSLNALRWEMMGEKYDPYRDREAYSPSEAARTAVKTHLQGGSALLGLHTASICFSDWPEWPALLGGHWVWGTSWHPPPELVAVTPTAEGSLRHLQAFEVHDELYTALSLEPTTTVLASGQSAAMPSPQPVMWSHTVGAGRVIYDALGHDAASLHHPAHAELLRQAVGWAVEKVRRS